MGLMDKLFQKNGKGDAVEYNMDILMLSQLAALYVNGKGKKYKQKYLDTLMAAAVPMKDAKAMFAFECDVVKKYNKPYLLHPDFTRMWFFGLQNPFFTTEPQTQSAILEERFLTMSELCKLADEAEWHFWYSHEKDISPEVWSEICTWKFRGNGGAFIVKYMDMIHENFGISKEAIGKTIALNGAHLSKYKWG